MINYQDFGLSLSKEPRRKAAYIVEDGSFINLEENKVVLVGYSSREPTHTDFSHLMQKNGIKDKSIIRVNDGTYLYILEEAYVTLKDIEPTKEQYGALLKWFDFLMLNSKKKYVCIGINSKGSRFEFINRENKGGLLPEQLIDEIKGMYKEKKVGYANKI